MKFQIGRAVITRNALDMLRQGEWIRGLSRHAKGDWGIVDKEDQELNDLALQEGTRLLSAYRDSAGTKYWVITEADRSYTTILLPDDY